MIKSHKESTSTRTITSGSEAVVQNLSRFIKEYLFPENRHKNRRHTTYVKDKR